MDTQTLVNDRIQEGLRFITKLVQKQFDVAAACWVKPSDEEDWYLYIASSEVDRKGLPQAYGDAYEVLFSFDVPWMSASQLKLVRSTDPLVAEVRNSLKYLGNAYPMVSRRSSLGDLSTQEVYIYPNIMPDEVLLKLEVSVTYVRQQNTSTWVATTKPGDFHRGVRARGVVSYSTARYEGERPEDERFAIVTVLVEIDPIFDDRWFLERPDTRPMLMRQARMMADELFLEKHAGARIISSDNGDPSASASQA
jgi:hypothetical protein